MNISHWSDSDDEPLLRPSDNEAPYNAIRPSDAEWSDSDDLPLMVRPAVNPITNSADELPNLESSDSEWDSEDDLPLVTKQIWSKKLSAPHVNEFQEEVGPVTAMDASKTPLDFFLLLFPEELFAHIVRSTNLYAQQCISAKPDPIWSPTNITEVKQFIGLIITMSILELPTYKMYWSTDFLFQTPAIPSIMLRRRFEKLLQYFHVASTSVNNPPKGQDGHDPLYHVRHVLDELLKNCGEQYRPHREQSVDEAMVAFKGRLSFKQYLPAKPTKFGIKIWVRADAHNGYMCNFQVYTGKKSSSSALDIGEKGLGCRVVLDLVQPIAGKHHEIYMDNFFSSPVLFNILQENGTYATGTCRPKRKQYPKELDTGSVKRQGEHKTYQLGATNLTATAWYDKRQVNFLSTSADPTNVQSVRRNRKDGSVADVIAPEIVVNYGKYMGGVDRADMIRTQYTCTKKSRKWWRYLFWFLIDTAIANALILMKESPNHQKTSSKGNQQVLSQLEFRKSLARALVGETRVQRKRKVSNIDESGQCHWPKKCEKASRCKHCLKSKVIGKKPGFHANNVRFHCALSVLRISMQRFLIC